MFAEAARFGVPVTALPIATLRPADANEVAEAWRFVMELKHEPAVLVLSRQALPTIDRTKYGISWNMPNQSGGDYVANDVKLTAELAFVKAEA